MFSALTLLGIWTARTSTKCSEAPLFSGSAYFSNRVPKAFTDIWVAHGGEISSGRTFDVRARYFFAMDPSEPWVVKLFAKSVMVIHAGWIAHCVSQMFQVPIAEYILDDRFIPGTPYKLTNNAPPIYVPLSEPSGSTDTESEESTPFRTSETPSTPTKTSRKRKREQAYFDSPSGSLVFSGFDKDGMPQRPRKQRKLRFDPSFSPGGGRRDRVAIQGTSLEWLQDHQDHHDALGDGVEYTEENGQDRRASALRPRDTPDKPLACEGPFATYRHLPAGDDISKPTQAPLPAIISDTQEKKPAIRMVDFIKPPPRTKRWPFPAAKATNPTDTGMMPSSVKSTDNKIKTPKKISFADHARVCVYMVSPQRPNAPDGADAGPARPCLAEGSEGAPEVNDRALKSNGGTKDPDDPTRETTRDFALQVNCSKINGDPTRMPAADQLENDTLALTMEEVQAMRRRLVSLTAENGVDNGQFATLFELGKTFRGMTFRHVW